MEERKLILVRRMVQISPKVTYDYNNYFESRKMGEQYDTATQTSLYDWEFMKDEILKKCSNPPLVQTFVLSNKKVMDTATTVKPDSYSNQDKVADNCSQTTDGSSVCEEKGGITSSSSKSKVDKIKEDFPPFKRWAKKVVFASNNKSPMDFVTPSSGESQPRFSFLTMVPKTEKVTIAESYGKMDGQEGQSKASVTQDNAPSKYNYKKEDTNNKISTYQRPTVREYSFQVKENQLGKFGLQRKVHYSTPTTSIKSKGNSNPFVKTMTESMTTNNQFSSNESEDESTGIGKSSYTKYLEYCRSQKLEPHSKTESDEESAGKSHYSKFFEYCRSRKLEQHSHTGINVTATKNGIHVVNPFKKTTSNYIYPVHSEGRPE